MGFPARFSRLVIILSGAPFFSDSGARNAAMRTCELLTRRSNFRPRSPQFQLADCDHQNLGRSG